MRYFDNKISSNPGSPIREVFAPKVKSDGSIEVLPTGKENTDAIIQSFAQSTDISFILAKLAAGDTSVLHQGNPIFGDFTHMPKTYAEVLQLQIDAGRAFDRLPVEVKREFDNDVNKFMASAGSKEWIEKLGDFASPYLKALLNPVVPDSDEKEVTE